MGLEFLVRVRRVSLVATAVAALLAANYAAPRAGLGLAAGALWSLVNLFLVQVLVVTLTTPGARPWPRVGFALGGLALLFAAGAALLARLPVLWLMLGFWLPLAVIVLKAGSLLLLESRAWRALARHPWRTAALVGSVLIVAWGFAPAALRGGRAAAAPQASVQSSAEAQGAAGAHEEKGPEKFPNVITVLARAFPDAGWARFLHEFEAVIFAIAIALVLCVVAFLATRRPQMIPGPLQNLVETLVESLRDFVIGILGPEHGPRYVPFLGSLFIYILAMNLFGLIPFMDSPTSNLNVTVSLALVVFVYAQYVGFTELGFIGYFDHMMGSPRTLIGWILVPLMLPIHLMGELAKPISLSCRLFGNIFGEDMLLVAFASLGVTSLAFAHLPIGLPLQVPFLFLALLTSTLQAAVFMVLSTIYILLMLPHHEPEHEGEVQHAH